MPRLVRGIVSKGDKNESDEKIITALCVLLTVSCFTLNVSALVFTEGDYGFELNTRKQTATVVEYTGSDTVVYVPGSYSNYPVTKVAATAFSGHSFVESINLPSSITTVENSAFESCANLADVHFPNSVIKLGENVCKNCSALETVSLNANISIIPRMAFAGCSSLVNLTIGETITDVGAYAFQYCTSLNDFSNFKNIKNIDEYAFDHTGFSYISIPGEVTNLRNH